MVDLLEKKRHKPLKLHELSQWPETLFFLQNTEVSLGVSYKLDKLALYIFRLRFFNYSA